MSSNKNIFVVGFVRGEYDDRYEEILIACATEEQANERVKRYQAIDERHNKAVEISRRFRDENEEELDQRERDTKENREKLEEYATKNVEQFERYMAKWRLFAENRPDIFEEFPWMVDQGPSSSKIREHTYWIVEVELIDEL